MEYLEGEELTGLISKGRLALDMELRLMINVCKGLGYARDKDRIHRDIKPANIFVTKQQQVKILDFGLARGLESTHADGEHHRDPELYGPEQVRGEPIDRRADIFSAGVVLYEPSTAASRSRPFGRRPHLPGARASAEPVDARSESAGRARTVVQRALAKNPADGISAWTRCWRI